MSATDERGWAFELRELERERRVLRRGMRSISDVILELTAIERSGLAHQVGQAHRALGIAVAKIDTRLEEIHRAKKASR